jgi:hypothetical protein
MNAFQRLTFKLFKYPKLKIEDVFTPAKVAKINYIERKSIDKLMSREMNTPGKQIIVFGHSGSGKTSSVINLLEKNQYDYIKTQCESNTSFEQLILNAFDELNVYVVDGRSSKKTTSLKNELAQEYQNIKSIIGTESKSEESTTYARLLPPQLTPQKLAQFMGKKNIVWLIEDFHKVSDKEKVRIADVIKIFVDNANNYEISKIICIGACESAHELIKLDSNLKMRVSEVLVPLLNEDEIREIVVNGFDLLNLNPTKSLVEKLVYYSYGLGASAHQMCLDICRGKKITHAKLKKQDIEDNSFEYAVDGFMNRHQDTFKFIYEAAVKNGVGWYILKTFSSSANEKLSFDEISQKVNKGKKFFDKDEIKDKLDELMGPSFNIICYNYNSDKYALTTPFWYCFLRLQFSIEKSQQSKKKKNNKNLNLNIGNKYKYKDEQIIEKLLVELKKHLLNEEKK